MKAKVLLSVIVLIFLGVLFYQSFYKREKSDIYVKKVAKSEKIKNDDNIVNNNKIVKLNLRGRLVLDDTKKTEVKNDKRTKKDKLYERTIADIEILINDLKNSESISDSIVALNKLKEKILSLDSELAKKVLISLLDSGIDFPTKLLFVVEEGGSLEQAPTLRTVLLDLFGQVNLETSVEYSRDILNSSRVQDEWALALRNMAWANESGTLSTELNQYFLLMLNEPEWRKNRSCYTKYDSLGI